MFSGVVMNRISTYKILDMYNKYTNGESYSTILQGIESEIIEKYGIKEDSIMDYLDEIISNDLSIRESVSNSELFLMEGYTHREWREDESCPFCEICKEDNHNQIIKRYRKTELGGYTDVVMFEPHFPCKDGHMLFVPDIHIDSITGSLTSARIVSDVMMAIGKYSERNDLEGNIIINNGKKADQTIFHLHIHFIPRTGNDDGTKLPWSKL